MVLFIIDKKMGRMGENQSVLARQRSARLNQIEMFDFTNFYACAMIEFSIWL